MIWEIQLRPQTLKNKKDHKYVEKINVMWVYY